MDPTHDPWSSFNLTPERRNSKDSIWNKFTSPYDPPSGRESSRALSPPPGLLLYKRLGQTLPPVSPRAPRSTSLPRRSLSAIKSRKLNTSFLISLSASTPAGQRKSKSTSPEAEDHHPQNKGCKAIAAVRKLKSSLSAEFLGDDNEYGDIGCLGGKRRPSDVSKSTNELESVKNLYLNKLDQYKVRRSSSKSDETLNTRHRVNIGVRGSESDSSLLVLKGQADKFSSLRKPKAKKNSPRPEDPSPDRYCYISSSENILTPGTTMKNDRKSNPEDKRSPVKHPEDDVSKQEDLDISAKRAKVFLVSATDHPQIIVRPGVSLSRSKSCPRTQRRRAASTPTEPKPRLLNTTTQSISFSTERLVKAHYAAEEVAVCTPMSHQAVADVDDGEEEDEVILEDIPSMPDLWISNRSYMRHSSRRPRHLPLHSHTPPGLPVSSAPPPGTPWPLPCTSHRRDEPKMYDTSDRMNRNRMNEAPWYPAGALGFSTSESARRCMLRHSMSQRSKSEERKAHLPPNPTVSGELRLYRHSAGASVINDPRDSGVVSEDEFGVCRGVIFDGSTSARTGVFPASLVLRRPECNVGGMSGRGKPTVAVKKVSPPTVPDSAALTHRHSGSSFSSGVYSGGDQRSSYSSSVGDDNPPPSPRSPARVTGGGSCDHGQLGRLGSGVGGGGGNVGNSSGGGGVGGGGGGGGSQQLGNNSPSHYNNNNNNNNNNQQQFTFPAGPHQQQVPQFAHLMCPKTSPGSPHHLPPDSTYTYLTYQQQTSLEDQGIDVQSPGRSSPGSGSGSSTTGSTASSGCRNSTTSLDSGRASTTTHSHQHRLSGQSYDSGSILRHSYHSSSSSLGSMEHDNAPHVNVPELLNNGVRDSEVLRVWLTDLRFEEYYDKFVMAGYDMPTISRMTPEDLNAIGITKPAHRKKLKAEITRLNISDGLPDFIPGRLEDWLCLLRLDEYAESLRRQQVTTVEQMTQLTWEDLEDIGISKLGHQKKVMLAIKRLKDIMAGKKFNNSQDGRPQSHYGAHEILIPREAGEGRDQFTGVSEFRTFAGSGHYAGGEHNRLNGPPDPQGHYGAQHYPPGVQYGSMPPPQAHVHPLAQQSGQFHPPNQYAGSQGPSPPGSKLPSGPPHPLPGPGQVQYRPDVVAVQVRPGGRGFEEPIYGSYQTFHPENRMLHGQGPPISLGILPPRPFPPPTALSHPHPHPQRSMDDGDITPTNEYAINYEGGGTLPRPRTANKLRPVAKVTAKTRVDVHEVPQFIKDGMTLKKPPQGEEICMKELNLKTLNRQNSEKTYNPSQGTGSSNNTPQGTPKKVPPPPPRRSNSISESSKEGAQEGTYGYLRRGLSYGYMGIKNNLQPDVTPDLPPPPAPPDSANHQHLPDEFPPPPPPLTCVTMANATRIAASSTITTSSMTSDSLATSQTSTTSSSDEEVTAGFRPRRNDSNASFKSTSSTDSETLPFANENAGTIKQRSCRPHPGLSLDPRASPHGSPRASPALRRKDAPLPLRHTPGPPSEAPPTLPVTDVGTSPDGTSDVLSDIGNMLANLTDELDAMLEQEVIKN